MWLAGWWLLAKPFRRFAVLTVDGNRPTWRAGPSMVRGSNQFWDRGSFRRANCGWETAHLEGVIVHG